MNAKRDYEIFLKKEADGLYCEAWNNLLMALWDNTSTYVMQEITSDDWLSERYYLYLRDKLNELDWQMTMAAIFDDAENRQSIALCVLACRILDKNYRWYDACSNLVTQKRLMGKYPNYMDYRNAMEKKAKELGYTGKI